MAFVIFPIMTTTCTYAQHLSNGRGIAIGGYSSLAGGIGGIDWNPAGLLQSKDWELNLSNYATLTGGSTSFSLHSVGVAKRFPGHHAAAIRYAPGKAIVFVVPHNFTVSDTGFSIVTSYDRRIAYEEPYALGYAFGINDAIGLGLTGRFVQEKVSDTQYSLDVAGSIRSQDVDYRGSSWLIDWGLRWMLNDRWTLSLVAKNLFKITESELPQELAEYRLSPKKVLRAGIGFLPGEELQIGFDVDTEKRAAAGLEWSAMNNFFLRGGVYLDGTADSKLEALAGGVGYVYDFLHFNIGYIHFLSQDNRRGLADVTAMVGSTIQDIEFNQFTSDRLTFTVRVDLGRTRETLVRIEYVEMPGEIYPSSATLYAFSPIAKARVRNVSNRAVDVRVSFFVDRIMDVPTETRPYTLAPEELAEIPLYAVFNDFLKSVSSTSIRDGIVYATATPSEGYDDRFATRLLVRGRNDWNGDVSLLRFFVTPDDPEVLRWSRAALNAHKSRIDTTEASLQNFTKAQILFDEFASRLTYVGDPRTSRDFVQYPAETLSRRSGDCDDMSICYAALLTSVGIPTAFVDVVPPERPDSSHIYLMFDTGLTASNASALTTNPKRYVIRHNNKGVETIWLPVETTAILRGFDEAWTTGAKQFFDDVEINSGLANGWVRIVDVRPVF